MWTFSEVLADQTLIAPFRGADDIPMRCTNCEGSFTRRKDALLYAIRHGKKGAFCSPRCGGVSTYPDARRRTTRYQPPVSTGPFPFSYFREDPTRLKPFDWKDPIRLSCSMCGATHTRRRESVHQALRHGQEGMFCSQTCAGAYTTEKTVVVVGGVRGRLCTICKKWRPLSLMTSGGHGHTCTACWTKQPERLFRRYEHQAKKRGYVFNLSYADFTGFWRKPCHYCGADIDSIGLDRVDNTVGYERANIVPCCGICNSMKLDQTEAEFLQRCRLITTRHPKP